MLEIFQNSVTEKMGTSKARWSRFLLFCKWGTAGVLHHAILSVLWPPLLLVGDSILCKRQKRFPIRQFKRTLAVLSRFVLRVFLSSWEGGGLLSFRLEKGRREPWLGCPTRPGLCSAELTEVGGRQLSTWCTLYTVQGLGGCTPTWRQSCNVQYGLSGAMCNVQGGRV